jgi:hypothetical protein
MISPDPSNPPAAKSPCVAVAELDVDNPPPPPATLPNDPSADNIYYFFLKRNMTATIKIDPTTSIDTVPAPTLNPLESDGSPSDKSISMLPESLVFVTTLFVRLNESLVTFVVFVTLLC